ncbi:hypothetical protein AB6A23_13895 [Paenibacillus tarimensis]
MTNPILIVPIRIDALTVNAFVLENQPFRRWGQIYTNVKQFGSAEPDPTDRGGGITGDAEKHTGVYVHWTLPDALKHGVQDPVTRNIDFPLVPNRWLVVRFSGAPDKRTARAFIVESDAPGNAESATYVFDPAIIEAWKESKDPRRQQAGIRLGSGEKLVADVLGQVFDLNGWSERGIGQLFVKAVAPGNPLFSAYQCHCSNVFSFRDPVDDVGDDSKLSYLVTGWFSNAAEDPLQKCQIEKPSGSSPVEACEQLLDAYSWTVAVNGDSETLTDETIPMSSLYHGMLFGVKWSRTGTYPTVKDKYKDQSEKGIHVAIGNTSIDAFKSMIERQLHDREKNGDDKARQLLEKLPNAADLLEAFQYDMLHVLDQPGGRSVLDHRIRQEWFGSKPGGYRWTVVDAESDQPANRSPQPSEGWLTELNSRQSEYDGKLSELHAEQKRLYDTWWKKGKFETYPDFAQPEGVTVDQFAKALAAENDPSYNAANPPGPDNIYSLPRKIVDLTNEIESAIGPDIPRPLYDGSNTPEEALAAGIDAYERIKREQGRLEADRKLKPVAGSRYWRANDPVVFISGAGSTSRIAQPGLKLECRLPDQVISALKNGSDVISTDKLSDIIPKLPYSVSELAEALQGNYIQSGTAAQLAAAIQSLIVEFFLLDPDNAAAIVSAYPVFTRELLVKHDPANFQGVLPALLPEEWQQPWNPFMLKWVADWYPIDNSHWSFDGIDYRYDGKAVGVNYRQIGNDILLTPQTSYIFKDRLKKFALAHRNGPDDTGQLIGQLNDLIGEIDNWDFISQSLTGFGSQLAVRDTRVNRAPDADLMFTFKDGTQKSLADLVGDQYDDLPYIRDTGDTLTFESVRQGQFAFSYLAVYDAFGQVLEIIGDSGLGSSVLFGPILAEGLIPDAPIIPQNPQRFIQLPPRLIQHSRLDFRLVDAGDSTKVADISPEANPVAGWLLPNHLDSSISLFDASGRSVGEAAQVTSEDESRIVKLFFSPQGAYTSMDDIENQAPHMAKMLHSLTARGADAFNRFLEVIDATLWTIDPLGARKDQNLSVLAGRPLALVRANLQFSLDGPAIGATGWSATFNPPAPDFVGFDYEVRLGEAEIRKDGLIGYFLNGNYDVFNCVHRPEAGESEDSYIQPIGPGTFIPLRFDGTSQADVMMLVDPRASVHAVTGIVPAQTIELPGRLVDPVLSDLNLQFRIGALLTELQQYPGQTSEGEGTTGAAIALPLPAERNGQWQWLEKQAADGTESWQTFGLVNIGQQARLHSRPLTLREGWIQFETDLKGDYIQDRGKT